VNRVLLAISLADGMDPNPLQQYPLVVRRVSVHARLEPAPWLLQQRAERTFLVVVFGLVDCACLCQEYVVERRAILLLATGRCEHLACRGMEEGNPVARASHFSGSGECEGSATPEEWQSFSEGFTAGNFTIGSTEPMTPWCLWQTGQWSANARS
jgi:hypothetical protein